MFYIATFINTKTDDWKFIIKMYKADYETDARDNAERDWNTNFRGWHMSFKSIPYFDHFGSAVVAEFSK